MFLLNRVEDKILKTCFFTFSGIISSKLQQYLHPLFDPKTICTTFKNRQCTNRSEIVKTALLHRHNQEVLDRINRLFERKKFRLVSQLMDHENGVFQFRGKKTYLLPTRNVEGLDLKVYRVSDTVETPHN